MEKEEVSENFAKVLRTSLEGIGKFL